MKTSTRIIQIGFPGGNWGKGNTGKLIDEVDWSFPTDASPRMPFSSPRHSRAWGGRWLLLLRAQIWLVLDMQIAWWVPLLRWVLGKKVVLYVDRPLSSPRPGASWRRWKEAWILGAASQVIAAHEAISDALKRRYDINSAVVCWCNQLTAGLSPAPVQAKPPDAYALGIAEVAPAQQLEVVLQAFAQYPRYRLLLLGNWDKTSYGQCLKAHYQAYPNIQLLPMPQDLTAWQQLKQNALFFLQTHAHTSQQLQGLIDAMQQGLPVISLDTPFNRKLTYDQAVYFQHPGELISQLETHPRHRLTLIGKNLAKQVQARQPRQGMAELCQVAFAPVDASPKPGLGGIASRIFPSVDQPDQRYEPAQQGQLQEQVS